MDPQQPTSNSQDDLNFKFDLDVAAPADTGLPFTPQATQTTTETEQVNEQVVVPPVPEMTQTVSIPTPPAEMMSPTIPPVEEKLVEIKVPKQNPLKILGGVVALLLFVGAGLYAWKGADLLTMFRGDLRQRAATCSVGCLGGYTCSGNGQECCSYRESCTVTKPHCRSASRCVTSGGGGTTPECNWSQPQCIDGYYYACQNGKKIKTTSCGGTGGGAAPTPTKPPTGGGCTDSQVSNCQSRGCTGCSGGGCTGCPTGGGGAAPTPTKPPATNICPSNSYSQCVGKAVGTTCEETLGGIRACGGSCALNVSNICTCANPIANKCPTAPTSCSPVGQCGSAAGCTTGYKCTRVGGATGSNECLSSSDCGIASCTGTGTQCINSELYQCRNNALVKANASCGTGAGNCGGANNCTNKAIGSTINTSSGVCTCTGSAGSTCSCILSGGGAGGTGGTGGGDIATTGDTCSAALAACDSKACCTGLYCVGVSGARTCQTTGQTPAQLCPGGGVCGGNNGYFGFKCDSLSNGQCLQNGQRFGSWDAAASHAGSCGQVDVVCVGGSNDGKLCGDFSVINNSCGTATPLVAGDPTPTPIPVCLMIKVYVKADDDSWVVAAPADLKDLVVIGDTIRLAVKGQSANFGQARFKINSADPATTTTLVNGEFVYDYVLIRGGDYSIQAELLPQ